MALTPPSIYSSLLSNKDASPNPFGGTAYLNLAQGVASGVAAWALGQPQNVALSGAAVGTAGAGAIVTPSARIIIPPTVPVMLGALQGAGLNGPLGQSLAVSMTLGICEAFNLYAQYAGTVAGVAVGQDVSKITTANAPALIGILNQTLPGAGVAGSALSMMATGLGNGIAALLLLGGGTASVAGTPVVPPAPGAGSSTSVVV